MSISHDLVDYFSAVIFRWEKVDILVDMSPVCALCHKILKPEKPPWIFQKSLNHTFNSDFIDI